MRAKKWSYTPADDDADGFGNDLAGTSGVAFVQTATTPGDGLAHLVIITPSGSVTGSYTLTGTDADGNPQTETLATDTTNAVTSTKYFKTLTSVLAPSGIGAETVDIGWTDDAIGPTIPLDYRASDVQYGVGIDVAGTIDCTLQHTFESVQQGASAYPSTLKWFDHDTLANVIADTQSNFAVPVCACRLKVNSVTAGATVALQIVPGRS